MWECGLRPPTYTGPLLAVDLFSVESLISFYYILLIHNI